MTKVPRPPFAPEKPKVVVRRAMKPRIAVVFSDGSVPADGELLAEIGLSVPDRNHDRLVLGYKCRTWSFVCTTTVTVKDRPKLSNGG